MKLSENKRKLMEKMEEFMRPDRSETCSTTNIQIWLDANHQAKDEA
jgi:hypothetical protein